MVDEGNPQIYITCGRGSLSNLRVVRHGIQVQQIGDSGMPLPPTGIWTLKEKFGDDVDKMMVVSFETSTIVLEIGSTIKELSETGIEKDTNTITAHLLIDDSIIQVYPKGIIHVKSDGTRNQWSASTGVVT